MKKINKMLLVILVMLLVIVTGCTKEKDNGKKNVYATFAPIYDFATRIIGDKMNVKMIITGNEEPHDFELKAREAAKISKADLIIYNGAHMESFIDTLKKNSKDDSKYLDLSTGLSLIKNEEHHHEEHEEDEDHEEHEHEEEHEEHEHHHHGDVNPHTWLSIRNVIVEVNAIYNKVVEIDPENRDYYKANLDKMVKELTELDKKYTEEFNKINGEKLFVTSHAAFNYLARDYFLTQVPITGVSPEDEPTAKKLKELTDFVKEKKVNTIFFEEKATPKVAEILAKEVKVKTDTLYTLETLTEKELKLGYVKLMETNLERLVKSFNE